MKNHYVDIMKLIEKQVFSLNIPYVTKISRKRKDPFKVLVSCILSLRTKDKVTELAAKNLFKEIRTPKDILGFKTSRIAKLIYPVGFYKNKAKVLKGIARTLVDKHRGYVPQKEDQLLSFKGVGRKTANLVLGLGFGVPSICVDTHVHRISNRLGWVRTNIPQGTEFALAEIIPKRWWIKLNTILVAFGQNICLPISPFCSRCYVEKYCKKRGVKRCR